MWENNKKRETLAYNIIRKRFTSEDEYDELCDSLYQYMDSYMNGYMFDAGMFMDEVENLIGIRGHEVVIDYIIKNYP